jgi:hypothetical protein
LDRVIVALYTPTGTVDGTKTAIGEEVIAAPVILVKPAASAVKS